MQKNKSSGTLAKILVTPSFRKLLLLVVNF